ncbi:MAG: lipoyl synthase [Bacteroidetes bacterium GWF2_42_66]|nr:MAG: lipoyl synthase [Bacteroidetes bacterium GWA2_42_15]OFX98920.1 MAG: lipoyl synthase [Bacteroidetes bacterium GWE2_42_39]OFY45718.1 MAG: lipoyl synthase [Bacteroidetes bacterium GWF2_42_66]
MQDTGRQRLPRWMKSPLPSGENYSKVKRLIAEHRLHTICTSGNCPNKGECWNAGTASFMIMGEKCTRNCRFCYVKNLIPDPLDWEEPRRLAETIRTLGLKHVVITSVDRDDQPDGGARFWAETIRKVKEINPGTTMETLIPDFNGREELVQKIIEAGPEVISHNLETVRRLTSKVRSAARYDRSLKVLQFVANAGIVSKSGIMLGLGEKPDEVLETMDDLCSVNCKVLTIGQYLQPDSNLMKVEEYIRPETFEFYREEGMKRGFSHVESSSLVRSSYHAEKHVY